ncbi:MAG: ornithine cyclodeaminase family protein [Proteobacteria bacterium]|nr:ornithine cyclodeaminase family protein [Pseudomonadota bacterium]
MIRVVDAARIRAVLDLDEAIAAVEQGFAAHAAGQVRLPPVGYLPFSRPHGDCHVKFGHINEDEVFVIKVATGFYDNPRRGLPSSNGFLVVISALTGEPCALLDDGGYLTDLRTAIAGSIVAKYLAPPQPARIGILGTGTQARAQVDLLLRRFGRRPVVIWGRNPGKAGELAEALQATGCDASVVSSPRDVCMSCDLIVTTTASTAPLIEVDWVRPGTHITAVGADAKGKQELDPAVFAVADIRVVDSMEQCVDHGETAHAVAAGVVTVGQLMELGNLVSGKCPGRSGPKQISVADLTGVAVQDIQIAKHVWNKVNA